MFNANEVEVSEVSGSKYQRAGVSEKVMITEFTLNEAKTSIKFKTINENQEEGNSKLLSLNQELKPGNKTTAWKVSSKYLIYLIMAATGKSVEEAKAVLDAKSEDDLVAKLTKTLIGKTFRGLFGTKEAQNGKIYVELYSFEPAGGTRLVYDPTNTYYNAKTSPLAVTNTEKQDLPF